MSLCIIDLQGHVVREYTLQELGLDSEALGSPMWSPDGKEIAFLADASLWLLSLSDDSVQNLTQETMATIFQASRGCHSFNGRDMFQYQAMTFCNRSTSLRLRNDTNS